MLCAGKLVYLDIENKFITEEGLATIHFDCGFPVLFETISIEDYPSCRDFFGNSTRVTHGEPALVLEYVGRPYKILSDDKWKHYDVYQVQLNSGEVRHVFKYNLSKSIILNFDALPTN